MEDNNKSSHDNSRETATILGQSHFADLREQRKADVIARAHARAARKLEVQKRLVERILEDGRNRPHLHAVD